MFYLQCNSREWRKEGLNLFSRGMVKLIQDLNREEVIPRAHACRGGGGRTQGGWSHAGRVASP